MQKIIVSVVLALASLKFYEVNCRSLISNEEVEAAMYQQPHKIVPRSLDSISDLSNTIASNIVQTSSGEEKDTICSVEANKEEKMTCQNQRYRVEWSSFPTSNPTKEISVYDDECNCGFDVNGTAERDPVCIVTNVNENEAKNCGDGRYRVQWSRCLNGIILIEVFDDGQGPCKCSSAK